MTSLAAYAGGLFVTYQMTNSSFGPGMANCTDSGAPTGRPDAAIRGCPTFGRLVRFPINADNTLGSPFGVINASVRACSQFGTGSIASVAVGPDGLLYTSLGSGGNSNAGALNDRGQFGGDPCGNGNVWGGHLRSQDASSYDGKILTLSPTAPYNATVFASGFFNPWRFTWVPDAVSV